MPREDKEVQNINDHMTTTNGEIPLLTPEEHRAVDLAGQLYTLIANNVVGLSDNREGDLQELRAHIHGIQHMVMAQAAARAYPGRYRLIGRSLADLG